MTDLCAACKEDMVVYPHDMCDFCYYRNAQNPKFLKAWGLIHRLEGLLELACEEGQGLRASWIICLMADITEKHMGLTNRITEVK